MEDLSIRNEANNFLLNYGINALPVRLEDLLDICNKMGYCVVTYQDAREQNILPNNSRTDIEQLMEIRDGFTFREKKAKIIYYRSNLPHNLKLKVIAHELGHIVLEHSGNSGILGQTDGETNETFENEADVFMRQVLSPLCVLHTVGIFTINNISRYTALDHVNARFITQEIRRYPFTVMPSDKDVIYQFRDFIDDVKQTFNALPTASMVVPTSMSEPAPTPKPAETPRVEKAAPKPVQSKSKPNKKSPDMVAFWGASICAFLLGGVLVFTLLLLIYGGF